MFILIVLFLVVVIVFFFFKLRRTAYSVTNLFTGFTVTKEYKVETFKDEWSPNGDGESLIIFDVLPEQQLELQNKCIEKKYNKLPIKEDLPDNVVFNYLDKTDSLGFYLLNTEKKDERNYSIVILNLKTHKLIVYNTIY